MHLVCPLGRSRARPFWDAAEGDVQGRRGQTTSGFALQLRCLIQPRTSRKTRISFQQERRPVKTALRHRQVILAVAMLITCSQIAHAAYCEGASHVTCYEGGDQSGRSSGERYNIAVEGLSEARTPSEQELARRAMKDALDPSTANPRAVDCNQPSIKKRSFSTCMAGSGPTPGLKMSIPCQQNLDDGRLLVDGQNLPTGSHYKVIHYQPSSNEMGWSHGMCEIIFTKN